MKIKYSVSDSTQSEFDSLPRVTLSLYGNNRQAEVSGLVDSGATINVLPYHIGIQLEQTNFFMEFDVCFYRSRLEFEIMPKSP